MIPEASDQIIMALIDGDYLNEERFALAFVRGKFKIKKWGRHRLTSELKQRNISKYLIDKALKQIPKAAYKATFESLAHKKVASIKGVSAFKNKKKLADYLLYRGWESSMVYEKVNQVFK